MFVNQYLGIRVLVEIPSCSGQMAFPFDFINKTRILKCHLNHHCHI